ncbi:MAG: hypothetical protein ACLU5B_00420 [Mediterraneibacter faecis]
MQNGWIILTIWIELRQGIGLQAYGNRDPKIEYKMLGYDMFGEMTEEHYSRYGSVHCSM